jgi:hypothetical protein
LSVPVLTRHDPGCHFARESDGGHSDASKRISDTHNLHLLAGEAGRTLGGRNWNVGRVFACALADGRSDGVLYDSLQDAVSHQKHNEDWFAYFRVTNGGMSVCQAASALRLHRQAREAGIRMEGTSPRVAIPRLTREAFLDQVTAYERRDWIRPGRH